MRQVAALANIQITLALPPISVSKIAMVEVINIIEATSPLF
jgi:hypothetical protein